MTLNRDSFWCGMVCVCAWNSPTQYRFSMSILLRRRHVETGSYGERILRLKWNFSASALLRRGEGSAVLCTVNYIAVSMASTH